MYMYVYIYLYVYIYMAGRQGEAEQLAAMAAELEQSALVQVN